MGQSDQLWAVKIKDRTDRDRYPGFAHLWILASDSETASRKTRRWLKQNDYIGWTVSSVELSGTIDVF